MILVGQYNTLPVLRRVPAGLFLGTEGEAVLLPSHKAPKAAQPGDKLRVFVYTDSHDRPVATTDTPKAVAGEFAALKVVDISPHGAFLDWGLDKDLLVPTDEQHEPLSIGDTVVVAVDIDRDERVYGAARLAAYLEDQVEGLRVGDQADVLVYGFTERGVRVIVNRRFSGMLFHNQVFQELHIGDTARAWVTGIRGNGLVDLKLGRSGRGAAQDAQTAVLDALKANDGFLPLHDDSDPEEIRRALQMSKKAFKKAVGGLYSARKLRLVDGGIQLENGDR